MAGSPTKRRRLRSRVQLSRDCASRFGWDLHGKTARSALYLTVKVAGGGTSVHACSVFPRRNRRGIFSLRPLICGLSWRKGGARLRLIAGSFLLYMCVRSVAAKASEKISTAGSGGMPVCMLGRKCDGHQPLFCRHGHSGNVWRVCTFHIRGGFGPSPVVLTFPRCSCRARIKWLVPYTLVNWLESDRCAWSLRE